MHTYIYIGLNIALTHSCKLRRSAGEQRTAPAGEALLHELTSAKPDQVSAPLEMRKGDQATAVTTMPPPSVISLFMEHFTILQRSSNRRLCYTTLLILTRVSHTKGAVLNPDLLLSSVPGIAPQPVSGMPD